MLIQFIYSVQEKEQIFIDPSEINSSTYHNLVAA
jgi:hypothetical protein